MSKELEILAPHPTLRLRDVIPNRKASKNRILKSAALYFTYNARAAIYQLLLKFPKDKGHVILVPAFHCVSVVEPVIRAGYKVLFYKINNDLSIDYSDFYQKLSADVAGVIVINYCGFGADVDGVIAEKEKYDYYVVEDCAHSFLNGRGDGLIGERGDMAIFSFSKLVPSYAGGAVRINDPKFSFVSPYEGIPLAHAMVVLKRLLEQVINDLDDGLLKVIFNSFENRRVALKSKLIGPLSGPSTRFNEGYEFHYELALAKIPWISRMIIQASNFCKLVSLRRKHFNSLKEKLVESSTLRKVFSELPDNVCPWAYPVLLRNRAMLDHRLRAMGVPIFTFGETLHPQLYKSGESEVIRSAEELSKTMMMIPIHQNFGCGVVESFSEKINGLLRSGVWA
jgi:perosamine synthetase